MQKLRSATFNLWLLCCVLGLLFGCASRKPKAAQPAAPVSYVVEQLHLMAIPVALNLDQRSGLDGLGLKVYATSRNHPKPQPIRTGALEVLMYDGLVTDATNAPQPICTWRYTAAELPKYEQHGAIGSGYQLFPRWGTNHPVQARVTVIARYHAPEAAPVVSAPSIIAVPAK